MTTPTGEQPSSRKRVVIVGGGFAGLSCARKLASNPASISGPTAPVETVDPDKWEAVMAVDVIGTFNVTRLSIPHLKNSPAGSIIVMSSLGGRSGYPNRSAYCAPKSRLPGLLEKWDDPRARGVRQS